MYIFVNFIKNNMVWNDINLDDPLEMTLFMLLPKISVAGYWIQAKFYFLF